MKQPDNPPEWATHWSPPTKSYGSNCLGFWVGNMEDSHPLFRGVAWPPEIGVRNLGGHGGLIYKRAMLIVPTNLENE